MRGLTLTDPAFLGAASGFSPLSLSPALWLDASDAATITSSGGSVSEWRDKSGNGRTVTQGTSTAQPTTGTATQNGLNVLSFDGGDSLGNATLSAFNFLHDGTVHIIALVARSTTNSRMYFGNTDAIAARGSFLFRTSTAALNHSIVGTAVSVVGNVTSASFIGSGYELLTILATPLASPAANRSIIYKAAGSAVQNNTATGTASTSNATWPFRVGASMSSATTTAYQMVGQIAEIVVVTGVNATEANRVALRDYLNTKWAVY